MSLDPMGVVGGVGLSALDAWYTNRSAQNRAHEQMDFQQAQYATRYQTQIKDLMAAGLNPMLAYAQSPGTAPQGSAAPVQKSDIGRSFNDSRIASAQEAQIREQTQKTAAETRNVNTDTMVKEVEIGQRQAQTLQTISSGAQLDALTQKVHEEIKQVQETVKQLQVQQRKGESDIKVNNSIQQLNSTLNNLRILEQNLVNQNIRVRSNEADILDPKATAAKTISGQVGAHSELWNKAIEGVGKIINPFRGTGGVKYPKKVGK